MAFREKGHEAYSCDIEPSYGGHPEWHIQDDVLSHLNDGWDLLIAHPPCKDSYFGIPLTEEHRKHLSEAQKQVVHGRVTDATKAKLRAIALAQQADPAYRAKHQAGLLAAMQTPEMREKLSAAHKGKTLQ